MTDTVLYPIIHGCTDESIAYFATRAEAEDFVSNKPWLYIGKVE